MKLIANGPGIGDSVFLTSVAHWYHLEHPNEPIDIVAKHKALFRDNPDIRSVDENWTTAGFPELHNQASIKEHNIQFMLKKLGVKNIPKWEEIRQYLYVEDLPFIVNNGDPYITFQVKAGDWTKNKNWSIHNWFDLIARIYWDLGIATYQVGDIKEKRVNEIYNDDYGQWMGRPLSEVASFIQGSELHICPVSGTMHIASGVGTKSVVIYGGREDPKITGYSNNINMQVDTYRLSKFTREVNCSPCWKIEDCPFGWNVLEEFYKPCTQLISVDQVFEEVKNAINS